MKYRVSYKTAIVVLASAVTFIVLPCVLSPLFPSPPPPSFLCPSSRSPASSPLPPHPIYADLVYFIFSYLAVQKSAVYMLCHCRSGHASWLQCIFAVCYVGNYVLLLSVQFTKCPVLYCQIVSCLCLYRNQFYYADVLHHSVLKVFIRYELLWSLRLHSIINDLQLFACSHVDRHTSKNLLACTKHT